MEIGHVPGQPLYFCVLRLDKGQFPGRLMRIVRGLVNARPADRGGVVAIGTFDGMHLGHQAIFARVVGNARVLGVPPAVLTFEPSPREYLDPDNAPPRLMRLRDKASALGRYGIDRMVLLRFDEQLRSWGGEAFIGRVLHDGLAVRHLVVGAGFTFGRRRSGDIELLRQFGALHGFGVEVVEPVELDGERVSSTRVREALATGQMDRVRRLLGRDFRMSGRVIRGRRLGRTLGYATANMRLHRRVSPVAGVFAVRVHGAGEEPLPGVASVGVRPTLGGGEPLLEAHVFDFDGDLYGRYLQVDFVEKLRDEVRFPSVDAMIVRIHADASAARRILTAG